MKYYAVRIGRKPGIYMTWIEAEKQVKGYKGAIYKSFTNKKLAQEFLLHNSQKSGNNKIINFESSNKKLKNTEFSNKTSKNMELSNNKISSNKAYNTKAIITKIYTDGSSMEQQYGGYGIVIISNKDIIEISGVIPQKYSPATNNVAELYAVKIAIKKIKKLQLEPVIIYSDSNYTVKIFNDWVKKWQENNWLRPGNKKIENLKLIQEINRELQGKNIKLIHVYSHNKNNKQLQEHTYYNDIADKLAKKGVYK